MPELPANWIIAAFWTFGPLVVGGIGWLIRLGYTGLSSFREGQARQNETLARIETELEWWRKERESNKEEMRSAWSKIDRHGELLQDHGNRITKVEAVTRSLES